MDEVSSVKGAASHGTLSTQQSQTSLYSSPEMVDFNSSALGGKLHAGSPGLSSSFVLVTDESVYGEAPLSPEYVQLHTKSSVGVGGAAVATTSSGNKSASETTSRATDPTGLHLGADVEPRALENAATSTPGFIRTENSVDEKVLSYVASTTRESGIQAKADVRDKYTQACPPGANKEKESTFNKTPSDRLQPLMSPLESPSEEIVDMSASTVLIERHVSQKEGRILKNNNKELRLKIKKLTEVLEQLQNENKRLKNESMSKDEVAAVRSALEDKERELKNVTEKLQNEIARLKNELKSKSELSAIESAVEKKERECRKRIEDLEEQQELELDQYRERLQSAVEYEAMTKEKLKENAKALEELKNTTIMLQEQLAISQREVEKSSERADHLHAKLQASETKRMVVESENSVLSEKVNRLMKELATLKHSSKHYHHHHQSQKVIDPEGSEGATSKHVEQEPVKQDHRVDTSQQGTDATKSEASLKPEIRSCPKPKPRQKYYEAHDPQRVNHDKVKQKEVSHRPRPAQALVAPKLQSVAHLQPVVAPRQQQGAAKCSPTPHDHSSSGAAVAYDPNNRPSFLPISGQKQSPPMPLLVPQEKPTLPLSDAQKLAATASWVQQLPEPEKKRNKHEEELPVATKGIEGNNSDSLSEERIEEITRQLKGENMIDCECPICGKVLHSRESDYGIQLHVEMCLQQSELSQQRF